MAVRFATRRNLIIAGAVLGVLALASMFAPRPIAVDSETVTRGPIAETVYDQGQARVRDAYTAAAPVAGRLERITLKVGDRVTAGQVVARIAPAAPTLLDPSVRAQRQAAATGAQADFERAQAEVVRTQHMLDRIRPLVEQGINARQNLDDATAAAKQAQDAATTAAAALKSAQAALMDPGATAGPAVSVTASSSGYVTHVLEPSERTVPAGTPLLEVSDSRGLDAVIEFLSQDAVRIQPGMAAEVYDWGGAGTLNARVRRVEPQGFTKVSALGVEEQRAYVWLEFTDPPAKWTLLGPGYRVWGRVFLRREANALKVPLGALQRRAGRWAVFRIAGGLARLTPISVGAMTDTEAEVTGGLAAGDPVIVFPSDEVKDGVAVKPRKAARDGGT